MLPSEVLEKLSWDMNIALKEAKAVAVVTQNLPYDESHSELISAIQEATAIAQKVQQGLITLLLSVLAHGVRSDHKLDAA